MRKAAILLPLSALVLSGCATRGYGRMQQLNSTEMAQLNCREIAIELSRVETFEDAVRGQGVDFRSVVGFVGDLGIGNAIEKSSALKSAAERRHALRGLEGRKSCPPAPQSRWEQADRAPKS